MGRKKPKYHDSRKTLNLGFQVERLKLVFPDAEVTVVKNARLVWTGEVQPNAMSRKYMLRVEYRIHQHPKVWVIRPPLQTRKGESLPHVYPGNALCLYLSRYGEWDSSMYIAETIIPWACLWLIYYEVWLATGVWCGSRQEHPKPGKKKILPSKIRRR